MAAARWIRYAYLAQFSRPKSARQLFRMIKQKQIGRIVEVGISDLSRTQAMIEVAQRYAAQSMVFHTGLDWFDARPSQCVRLSVKDAYRVLRSTDACVRLVPGSPGASLAAVANAHQNTDLILVSSLLADEELNAAWFYVPRMLHAKSLIIRERSQASGEPSFEHLTLAQVAKLASQVDARHAA